VFIHGKSILAENAFTSVLQSQSKEAIGEALSKWVSISLNSRVSSDINSSLLVEVEEQSGF
jgi:hypothetical protein